MVFILQSFYGKKGFVESLQDAKAKKRKVKKTLGNTTQKM